MDKPEALRLAEMLKQDPRSKAHHDEAADELRRLHEAHDWQYKMAGERLRRVEKLEAQRYALLEALKEIAADYADRFDLDSPSTNPGIKFTIEQARAAIKAVEEQK